MPKSIIPLRRMFQESQRTKEIWIDKFTASIGTEDGTILSDLQGKIWVRSITSGIPYEVHNDIAPTDRFGLQVLVGRLAGDDELQVIKSMKVYGLPASRGEVAKQIVEDHFFDWERFKPFLTIPTQGGGMVVTIFGDRTRKSDGSFGSIANQPLDLSAYVPASGALYVLIEADEDGVIYVTDGTPVAAKELLTLADIPSATAGRRASCAVRIYAGQTQLYRVPGSPMNDFIDLRTTV